MEFRPIYYELYYRRRLVLLPQTSRKRERERERERERANTKNITGVTPLQKEGGKKKLRTHIEML